MKKDNLQRIYTFVSFGVLILILFIIYHPIFFSQAVVGGDFGYLFNEQFSSYPLLPPSWQTLFNLGYANSAIIWTGLLLHISLNTLGKIFDFRTVVLMTYILPFFVIGGISMFYLIKSYITDKIPFILLGVFIYLANTYTIMLLAGGQFLIALSYAIFPLSAFAFMRVITVCSDKASSWRKCLYYSLLAGIVIGVQVLFDPRITYITLVAVSVYFLLTISYQLTKKNIIKIIQTFIYTFVIPLSLLVGLHALWIVPTLLSRQNHIQQLGSAFSSSDAVRFFSFAKLENTIGLLHPNWPENIFGLVHFMRPEFLLLPLLAFTSLFFLSQSSRRQAHILLYFALLGLLGSFLAKGANDPFGPLYIWLFEHAPGFILFRDSTKFYVLVALSYAVLIPFTILTFYQILLSKKWSVKKLKVINAQNSMFFFISCFLLLVVLLPVTQGKVGGTFKYHTVPHEYIALKDFLLSQKTFSRTLWIPSVQRFGYYSDTHPVIHGQEFFQTATPSALIKELRKPETKKLLQEASVKYVIVPYDSERELFVTDRKYDEEKYQQTKKNLQNISWLECNRHVGKLMICSVDNVRDHFWIARGNDTLKYQVISSTEYKVTFTGKGKKRLIFSEQYDPRWIAQYDTSTIPSKQFHTHFNSFEIPASVTSVTIFYEPQRWIMPGAIISGITITGSILLLVVLRRGSYNVAVTSRRWLN